MAGNVLGGFSYEQLLELDPGAGNGDEKKKEEGQPLSAHLDQTHCLGSSFGTQL